jgi:phage tail-like protein
MAVADFPVVFHFKVEFGDGNAAADHRFQEVNGLVAEVTTEDLREGGLNEYVHRLPTGAKYGNLVLKRGFLTTSEVTAWCRRAIEEFVFEPRDVLVTLLDERHEPLAGWTFLRAYPVKWSVSDLKAQDNAIAVESMELSYRMMRRVGV